MFAAEAAGPDWAAITAAVGTAVTAGILGITAIIVSTQLRDARKTRHGQLLTDLSRRWDERLVVDSQTLFAKYTSKGIVGLVETLYDEGNADEEERADFVTLEAVPNFWETVGVLEADGAIATSVVYRMWGEAIRAAWRDWEEPVGRLRELTQLPDSYRSFERLAVALRDFEPKPPLTRRLDLAFRPRQRWNPKTLVSHISRLLHRPNK